MIKNILSDIKKSIKTNFIRNEVTYSLGSHKVSFHKIKESNLLKQIAAYGIKSHEPELCEFIQHYNKLEPDFQTFIDGGANIGLFSTIATIYHPKAKVVAVEPFRKNVEYLNKLVQKNKIEFKILDKALSDSDDETVELFIPISTSSSKLSTSASLINSFKDSGDIYNHLDYYQTAAKTIKLDTLCQMISFPSLIKLDCGGNEFKILSNAIETLNRHNADFIIEIMINDKDKQDIFSLMTQHGYKGYLMTISGLIQEDRPLTLPYPTINNRTLWKNHFFTKKDFQQIQQFSKEVFGYFI